MLFGICFFGCVSDYLSANLPIVIGFEDAQPDAPRRARRRVN